LVNAERFVTKELLEFESRVQDAYGRIEEKEKELFAELVKKLADSLSSLRRAAEWIAYVDVAASLSLAARKMGWTKPPNCPREDTKDKEWQTSRGGMVQRCSFCAEQCGA